MDTEQTLELFGKLSNGAKVAIHSLEYMRGKSQDTEFSKELAGTIAAYKQIENSVDNNIEKMGGSPKPLSAWIKLNGKIAIGYKTFVDTSKPNMSKIVLRGFDRGEKSLEGYEKKYINAEDTAKEMCKELLDMQQKEKRVYVKYLN